MFLSFLSFFFFFFFFFFFYTTLRFLSKFFVNRLLFTLYCVLYGYWLKLDINITLYDWISPSTEEVLLVLFLTPMKRKKEKEKMKQKFNCTTIYASLLNSSKLNNRAISLQEFIDKPLFIYNLENMHTKITILLLKQFMFNFPENNSCCRCVNSTCHSNASSLFANECNLIKINTKTLYDCQQ